MLRTALLPAIFALLVFTAEALGQARLGVTDEAIRKNLQVFSTITLGSPAPEGGVDISLVSSDEKKLLISKSPLEEGTPALTLKVRAGFRESPEFWLQAFSDEGTVTYRVSGAGYAEALGTVSLSPSAIILSGPYGSPTLMTNVGASPVRLRLTSVRLNSSQENPVEQLLAVAPSVDIPIVSSNPKAGKASLPQVTMKAATSTATLDFIPAGEGETTLSAEVPAGFHKPPQGDGIIATVRLPGLAVSDQILIGQNLQVAGVLSLGAAAPDGGVTVTLTSRSPQSLLLSDSATRVGSASLALTIAKGAASATYYLQATAGSGTAEYVASAKGFRERSATIGFAPSGIVLTPAEHGPPDEAQVLRSKPGDGTHVVSAGLKRGSRTPLVAWTVQLDPVTHRSADITVQPLRAGMTVNVPVRNSSPKVGRVPAALRIAGGSEHATASFEALHEGSTTISVETPGGFTESANSTSVVAIVGQ
jgi:hypothetical protein